MIIKPDNIEKYIIKASHNIIDLIEDGDYVNGNLIEMFYEVSKLEKITKSIDYDYLGLIKVIDEVCKKYPLLQRFSIGKSCAGREIIALKTKNACEYVLFAAAFHGSEHITSNVLMCFMEEFANAYINNTFLAGIKLKKA